MVKMEVSLLLKNKNFNLQECPKQDSANNLHSAIKRRKNLNGNIKCFRSYLILLSAVLVTTSAPCSKRRGIRLANRKIFRPCNKNKFQYLLTFTFSQSNKVLSKYFTCMDSKYRVYKASNWKLRDMTLVMTLWVAAMIDLSLSDFFLFD